MKYASRWMACKLLTLMFLVFVNVHELCRVLGNFYRTLIQLTLFQLHPIGLLHRGFLATNQTQLPRGRWSTVFHVYYVALIRPQPYSASMNGMHKSDVYCYSYW